MLCKAPLFTALRSSETIAICGGGGNLEMGRKANGFILKDGTHVGGAVPLSKLV